MVPASRGPRFGPACVLSGYLAAPLALGHHLGQPDFGIEPDGSRGALGLGPESGLPRVDPGCLGQPDDAAGLAGRLDGCEGLPRPAEAHFSMSGVRLPARPAPYSRHSA